MGYRIHVSNHQWPIAAAAAEAAAAATAAAI